jgi:hypothetical protein
MMADLATVLKEVLTALLDVFQQTVPDRENTREWKEIRDVSATLRPFLANGEVDNVLDQLLATLGHITPDRENTREWAAIRAVCAEQRASSNSTKAKLSKLLDQLGRTTPDRENTREWARIREVCATQLVTLAGV